MNNYRLSLDPDSLEDSRGELEVDKLRDEVKQKQSIIEEKSKIINSLRQQVNDYQHDIEEFENNEQLWMQREDRLKKDLEEKNQEIDAITHARKEVETGFEALQKRYEARTVQLQKCFDDLKKAKEELEETQRHNEQLQHEKELLIVEAESANSRKRSLRDRSRDDEEALAQEIHDLKAQINLLKQQNGVMLEESEKRTNQLKQQQQVEEEEKAKFSKQVEDLREQIGQLQQQNERLSGELKQANSRQKLPLCSSDRGDQTYEEMVQELYDLRAQVKSLNHRQSRRSIDEEILKLKQELDVTETSWKLERQHKERYARENLQLDRKVHEMNKELNSLALQYAELESKYLEMESKLKEQISALPPPLPPKAGANQPPVVQSQVVHDENRLEVAPPVQFVTSTEDEEDNFMESSSKITASVLAKEKRGLKESILWDQQHDFRNKRTASNTSESLQSQKTVVGQALAANTNYCVNHRIKKSQFYNNDPIAEQKMRIDRANELARRNMLSKPLHQTSYPLELDTFDTTNLTEIEIKRGNIPRQALADFSNQRKPVKKAEAFII